MKKKFSKILGVGLAVSLVLSLMVTALPVSAHDSVTVTADPTAGFADPPLDVDIRVQVDNAQGTLDYRFDWEYKQNGGDSTYYDLDTYPMLFSADDIAALEIANIGPTNDNTIMVARTFSVPGWYELTVDVADAGGNNVDNTIEVIRVLGIIPEDIAYNVKGAQHAIAVKGLLEADGRTDIYDIEWSLVSGVDLDPTDIMVKIPIDVVYTSPPPIENTVDPTNPASYRKVGWTEVYEGSTGQQWVEGFSEIHIEALKRGDIHIYATVSGDPLGGEDDIVLHTEKKWGELARSVLDLEADEDGIQGPSIYIQVDPTEMGYIEEVIEDTIYATFLEVVGERTVGDAIVNWWLFDDTVANQDLIDELMDHLASQDGWVEPYWQAAGKYNTEWLADWMADLGYVGPADREPFDAIDFLAKPIADGGLGLHADTNVFSWDESGGSDFPDPWYYQNVTPDSWPNEDRGVVQATLVVQTVELEECIPEEVMIVILVSYPGSGDPTDDPFNGENIVIIEKGKKQFHKTALAEVKTPQLRWAGEKILLEKDWGDVIGPNSSSSNQANHTENGEYIAVYHLESQSIGELHESGALYPGNPTPLWEIEKDAGDIWVRVGPDWPISAVILQSEVQGEADINATLYYATPNTNWPNPSSWGVYGPPIAEIGFLVYYLAFEDVVLAEDVPLGLVTQAGEQIDVTTLASLHDLNPVVDDAIVAVQVRGWFTSAELPGTARPAVDLDGDGIYDMPAGRYVMPNDWPALAAYNYELRPNWDLMDQAHLDSIVSDAELGPYDGAVASAGLSGEAAAPNIGPFNTVQQWSVDDLWIAEATVVADRFVAPLTTVWDAFDVRNTVVPDGMLDWFDAPMPQALVLFQIESYSTAQGETPTFSELEKGDLEGYGVENGVMVDPLDLVGDVFQSPFYEVEIASHSSIPGGYNWDSWGTNGPYVYWIDLDIDSIIADTNEDPVNPLDLEVYSDNHGIAGVTIDALMQAGSVTFIAKAEYPYSPKKGKYGPMPSDEITAIWGAIELNPHFLADKNEVDVDELIVFTNETAGGTHPYTKAEWDFNADGIPEITLTGTEAQVMAIVTYAYDTEGLYTVRLTMTDSTPTTRHEDRIDYITVGAERVKIWNMPIGGETLIAPNPGAGRPFLTVAVDPAEITVSAGASLWGIYYLDETVPGGEWLYYIPGFVDNTLAELEPDKYYYVVVSAPSTLTIPQEI